MKLSISLWLVLIITGLLALSGCLFKRNLTWHEQNRKLILQNDSLISVNIELTRRLSLLQSTDSLAGPKISQVSPR